jgi:uncharacterized protein (DUF433 family)
VKRPSVKASARFAACGKGECHICHGKSTFHGTRVPVAAVLKQVANGVASDSIIAEWYGSVSREVNQKVVHLASQLLLEHATAEALA